MEVLLSQFIAYNLKAADGYLGTVRDFYFDDRSWKVTYVAIEIDDWMDKEILISPFELLQPDISSRTFPLRITRKQMYLTLNIADHQRIYVANAVEDRNDSIYNSAAEGSGSQISFKAKDNLCRSREQQSNNLRRTQAVAGSVIRWSDTVLGKICDYIIEDSSWKIRYVVIRIEKSVSKKYLLMDSRHLNDLHWSAGLVELNL